MRFPILLCCTGALTDTMGIKKIVMSCFENSITWQHAVHDS